MNRHREKVNIDENEIRPYNTKKFSEASQDYNKLITNFFLKATATKKLLKNTVKQTRKKQTPELYAIE